ncbi:hypothetical protein HRbin10_00271 [bacterium HR10]|nr:hypothetical protein HRbin10_00271 [bacterium HR10]
MPTIPHLERHFRGAQTIRDIVIGMSDGLTVPFALAAGLSGVGTSTNIIVTAGLAEIAAGAIAMGLGGYLAAKTELEHYVAERMREQRETERIPEEEAEEVAQIFRHYGLAEEQIGPLVAAIRSDPERWVDFMMRFELGLEPPDPVRARRSAFTIGFSYIVGGLIPLFPYMLLEQVLAALGLSVLITPLALFLFGYIKGRLTGIRPWRSALQTLLIGGLAATAAFLIARAIG